MKKTFGLCTAIGASMVAILAGTTSLRADDNDDVPYYSVGGGANLIQDVKVNSGTAFGPHGTILHFDNGVRFDITAGCKINDWVAFEAEMGFSYNRTSPFASFSLTNTPLSVLKASVYQIPIMPSLVLKHSLTKHLSITAGVGAGVAATIFDVENGETDSDWQFAYQAKAGLSYAFNEHIEGGLMYKFLGTTDHDWNINNVPGGTQGTMAQALMLTMTFRF